MCSQFVFNMADYETKNFFSFCKQVVIKLSVVFTAIFCTFYVKISMVTVNYSFMKLMFFNLCRGMKLQLKVNKVEFQICYKYLTLLCTRLLSNVSIHNILIVFLVQPPCFEMLKQTFADEKLESLANAIANVFATLNPQTQTKEIQLVFLNQSTRMAPLFFSVKT